MNARGGYRGHIFGKKSRKWPTTKVSVYQITRDKLNSLAEEVNLPVIELIYRVTEHSNLKNMIDDIKDNLAENWQEQEL